MSEPLWPVYFARTALDAPKLHLAAGQAFPFQDKRTIRGLGPAYGCADADRLSFGELPYVVALNVRTEAMARHILTNGLTLEKARALLTRKEKPAPAEEAA